MIWCSRAVPRLSVVEMAGEMRGAFSNGIDDSQAADEMSPLNCGCKGVYD